jgi:hypothetical protein
VSAAELLKELKALPAIERDKVIFAALEMEDGAAPDAPKATRVEWPDVEQRAKQIFGRRVFPNLVLMDRGEETA